MLEKSTRNWSTCVVLETNISFTCITVAVSYNYYYITPTWAFFLFISLFWGKKKPQEDNRRVETSKNNITVREFDSACSSTTPLLRVMPRQIKVQLMILLSTKQGSPHLTKQHAILKSFCLPNKKHLKLKNLSAVLNGTGS